MNRETVVALISMYKLPRGPEVGPFIPRRTDCSDSAG